MSVDEHCWLQEPLTFSCTLTAYGCLLDAGLTTYAVLKHHATGQWDASQEETSVVEFVDEQGSGNRLSWYVTGPDTHVVVDEVDGHLRIYCPEDVEYEAPPS